MLTITYEMSPPLDDDVQLIKVISKADKSRQADILFLGEFANDSLKKRRMTNNGFNDFSANCQNLTKCVLATPKRTQQRPKIPLQQPLILLQKVIYSVLRFDEHDNVFIPSATDSRALTKISAARDQIGEWI